MASLVNHLCRRQLAVFTRPSLTHIGKQTSITQKRYMPVCTVDTNLKKTEVPKDFNSNLSKLIATMLNKPEKLISVVLKTDVDIVRDGTDDPSATVHIWSIGVFDEQKNPAYSKQLFEFLPSALNMPDERITVMLHPIEKKDAAHLLYADMKAKQ